MMQLSRIAALDALRGLAIAGMLLSGQLPQAVLPGWMYHAQNPPPLHVFSPGLPGITWVDLVFPFFLFALGVAIPLAQAPALARGQSLGAAAWGIVRRACLLAAFAIYVRHISVHAVALGAPWKNAVFSILGFALLLPLLARLPASWPHAARLATRGLGLAGAVLLLSLFRDASGAAFSMARSDIIMLVMANVALSAGLLWLLTRRRPALRLAFLCFLLALRLCRDLPGWGSLLWHMSPLPALFNVAFHQYLFIVVPGTLIGDLLLRNDKWSIAFRGQLPFALSCAGMIGAAVTGLYLRLWWTTLCSVLLLAGVGGFLMHEQAPAALRRLHGWAVFLLLLGLALDPFEGGIQKGVATLSYYLVGAGTACAALLVLISLQQRGRGRCLAPLLGTGQNPLMAYTALHTLVTPLLILSGIGPLLQAWGQGAWLGCLRALVLTGIVCGLAAWSARRGLILRA
jgi:predicted acyltransferase